MTVNQPYVARISLFSFFTRCGSRYFFSVFAVAVLLALGGCQSQYRTIAGDAPDEEGGEEIAAIGSSGYLIGPEDLLEISVWNEEDLDREVLVRPDGGISFPLAGSLEAAGKTTEELRQDIQKEVREYIPGAVVSVSVKEVAGYTIFVIGRVNEPGQYTLGRYVDVIQALTLAGGLDEFADESDIKVLRRKEGEEVVLPFNYAAVKAGNNLSQNVTLQSGDTVVVP